MIGAPQTLTQVIKERLVKQCDIAATNLVAKYRARISAVPERGARLWW
jgi:hypothetical protein